MGIEFEVSCNSCGFARSFFIGNGAMPNSVEYALSQIHHKRRPKVQQLVDEHTVHASDHAHRFYRCKRCGQLRNSYWVRIVYDGDEIYETNCLCGKCNRLMTCMDDHLQIKDESCPCCGEKRLGVREQALK